MARSSQSSSSDDEQKTESPEPTPAANPAGLEERVTKLEEQLAKLMPRIEAITGPI